MAIHKQSHQSYTLGLDIGIASVGAALLGEERILGLHVRTFDRAETAEKGESLNKIRREARLTRRRIHRRSQRLLRLRRLLKRHGLLPNTDTAAFTCKQSPWELRAEGLDRGLDPSEFATALYHLVKHRGFQSNRKSEAKADEKAGQMLSSVSQNQQLNRPGFGGGSDISANGVMSNEPRSNEGAHRPLIGTVVARRPDAAEHLPSDRNGW
ncbi:MAG: type II CRISPR RNA-guided endonuclease Cas9 [Gammaproteobacteria bacterium]